MLDAAALNIAAITCASVGCGSLGLDFLKASLSVVIIDGNSVMAIYDDKKIEDIAEFEGDDPLDDLRYFCKAAKKFIMGEIGNMNLAVKKQEIVESLKASGDMTSYYRRMEKIEQDNQATMQDCIPVSRRSRFSRRAS